MARIIKVAVPNFDGRFDQIYILTYWIVWMIISAVRHDRHLKDKICKDEMSTRKISELFLTACYITKNP